MERRPQPEITLSQHVRFPEEWQEVLTDSELVTRFTELVELTQASVDVSEYPWVVDGVAVGMRWQHTIEMLGQQARSHSHPLFNHGNGWSDKERVAEVLEPIKFRSFDASFIENSLILAHSLAITQQASNAPGLSVSLNTINSTQSNSNPELVAALTKSVDLRDMDEPTQAETDTLTLEDYARMSEDDRAALYKAISRRLSSRKYLGTGYGWDSPPSEHHLEMELYKLRGYEKVIEYGTDDNQEIREIRDKRKGDEIASLREERDDFGKTPDTYPELPRQIKLCVGVMFQYFDNARDPFESINIDTYTLGQMDFSSDDLTALTDAGILVQQEPSVCTPDGYVKSYKLATDYYECWVCRHYPANEI